jgi:hypothetical protein
LRDEYGYNIFADGDGDYILEFLTPYANDKTGKTILSYLKEYSGQGSPKAFMDVIERLETIRNLNINLDMKDIHPNRLRQLSRLGSKYEPHSFRRFEADKRYAILAVYLYDLSQSLTDTAVEIHDRQINILLSKGRKKQEEIQKQNGKTLNEKIIQFISIGAALIKARSEGIDPFEAIEEIMDWDMVVESVEEAENSGGRDVEFYLKQMAQVCFRRGRRYK